MLIFQFHHFIKPELVEAYKAAILANARLTVQEPGIIRFDVLQDSEDPTHFCLMEVYRDAAARETHLQTAHFLQFKDTVFGQEMFARKGMGWQLDALFPDEEEAW
ncbi:MAG: antibiotic biosynthesis monooxygenase [Ardenticatenaceae bacterium]|nr:antibiotic biosynthesis monooxygenase [Anaerolineales bacterium]MCB8921409.1 antibiotic biosynthesis monooxygenase [Ardenticatenaceae bacterium]MCB9005114.1 antibiotic biosynthesis monooxygenase [Ardenticatenaceae bacterium]